MYAKGRAVKTWKMRIGAVVAVGILLSGGLAQACSRGLLKDENGNVITSRSMDWMEDLETNLWVFPRGLKREGAAGADSISWTSKYGSVVAAAYDQATADGMNEKGLVANVLYLSESQYPDGPPVKGSKALSTAGWAQYVLDNYASVAEAVTALQKQPFYLRTLELPGGHAGTVHLALSDASGDSAVIEYINHKQVIHHKADYVVMTNSPPFDDQLALNTYWNQVGGINMLPGTHRPADRFVRMSFYLAAAPTKMSEQEAVASAFSVIRNVSVPLGISVPGYPNIAETLWRTVADQKHMRYYFENTKTKQFLWLDMNAGKLDFSAGAPTRKLDLQRKASPEGGPTCDLSLCVGEANGALAPAEPYPFLPATTTASGQ